MSNLEQPIEVSSFQGGKTELDTSVESFIKETAAKFAVANDEEITPVVKQESKLDETLVSEGAKLEAHQNTVETTKIDPDRGLERLVEREVALRSRESALQARETALVDVEARIKALESRAIPADLADKMEYQPEDALRAMGFDPEHIVRQVIANRLGPDAAPEIKNTIESSKIKREMAELRAQLNEHRKMQAAQAFITQVQTGAREYVTKGIGQDVPTVASVAKTNPERVYREIMEEISRDASSRAYQDPNGDVLPYIEAAKRVEARWSEFKTMLTPPILTDNMPAPAIVEKPVHKTTPPTQPKPPERPIAPWLQRGELEEEGLRAAMAAYKKAEGQ